jgi:hypothetical protein
MLAARARVLEYEFLRSPQWPELLEEFALRLVPLTAPGAGVSAAAVAG